MSRAFVDEDAGSDDTDGMHEIPSPLPPGARNYMTPEGAARMTAEFRALVGSERPRIEASLSRDPESSRRLAEIDRRISYLSRMSAMLEVVGPPTEIERVSFGLRVRVREEQGGEREYRIVGADESDPERGLLSWSSPVARALMGKRAGDTATARLPGGESRIVVLEILRP